VRCDIDLATGAGDIKPLIDGYRAVLANLRRQAGGVEAERELLLHQIEYYRRIVAKLAGAGTNFERLLEPSEWMMSEDQPWMLRELAVLAFLHSQVLLPVWLSMVGAGVDVDAGIITLGLVNDARLPEEVV